MGYKFSLAAVLRVRTIIEEREESKLQKILFEIGQIFHKLEHTGHLMSGCQHLRYEQVLKPSLGLELQASYAELQSLKQLREELVARIETLEASRDAQIIVYEAARRNRQMLTDMRQKQRDLFNTEATKREQKMLDDNYIARRGRN